MKKVTPDTKKASKPMDSKDVRAFNQYMKDAVQVCATNSHLAHASASKVILSAGYATPPKSIDERIERMNEVSEQILSSKEKSQAFLVSAGII